jgi:hypothetical protein
VSRGRARAPTAGAIGRPSGREAGGRLARRVAAGPSPWPYDAAPGERGAAHRGAGPPAPPGSRGMATASPRATASPSQRVSAAPIRFRTEPSRRDPAPPGARSARTCWRRGAAARLTFSAGPNLHPLVLLLLIAREGRTRSSGCGEVSIGSTLRCLWQRKVERVGSGGDRDRPGRPAHATLLTQPPGPGRATGALGGAAGTEETSAPAPRRSRSRRRRPPSAHGWRRRSHRSALQLSSETAALGMVHRLARGANPCTDPRASVEGVRDGAGRAGGARSVPS